MEIIRGTTPILVFTFSDVSVSDIDTAILTIKQNGTTIITKDLTDATTAAHTISWQLSQTDTLSLNCWTANVYCDWKLANGVRGASSPFNIGVVTSGVSEVI